MKCNQSVITLIILITIVLGTLIFFSYKDNKKIKEINTKLLVERFGLDDPIPTDKESIINTNNAVINNKLNNLITYLSSPDSNIINNDINIKDKLLTLAKNDLEKYGKSITESINPTENREIISNLDKQIKDIENIVANKRNKNVNNNTYSKIKSLNNGLELDLIRTPDTYFNEYNTGSNVAAYMVGMNCGCLSTGSNDYDIFQCNDKDIKQYFKLETIYDKISYENNIDMINPISGISEKNINYPFTLIKSVNNGNCLTNNQGSITVQPCSSLKAQRWITM
jgi:hypothetical protein